ncbi:MAG: PIN domain-containing protein [Cyanobacteria bacterium P01_F01_bin.13]
MSVEITSGHFLDSNIWIYALTQNQSEQKQKIAAQLIQTSDVVISTQVINEVCVNLKKKANFSEDQIRSLVISFYQGSGVIAFDTGILTQASSLREQYAFSFWDSLIVSSALMANVSTLYSEDMQNGLIVDGQLVIVNPFNQLS